MRLETAEQSRTREERAAEPQRRCAVTRAHRPKDHLLRFVIGPDGTVVPDLKEKLPGRGVWLTAARDTIAEAVKRKAFGRALKTEARAPENLADQVGQLLDGAALGAFSLANKAGAVAFGHGKVEDALAKERVIALIHAADAAKDGCRKLDGKARAATKGRGLPVIGAFTSDELGLASGRTNVIHAALIQGGAARKFLAAASRAERYRQGISAFADKNELDTDQE